MRERPKVKQPLTLDYIRHQEQRSQKILWRLAELKDDLRVVGWAIIIWGIILVGVGAFVWGAWS
jgi:hypothetical protein